MLACELDHTVQKELQEVKHKKEKEELCSTHDAKEKHLQEELEKKDKLIAEKDAKINTVFEDRINDLHEHNRQTREELQNGRQAQAFLCKGLLEATRSMSALSMQMTQLLSSAQINQQERTMEIGEEMGWEMP
ncbi:hypothetical protein PRIPAC_91326, partial [Pristionchus pacificus]